jgi:TRAP-type mannitol/chloroaromatic compound transport system permease small subunit
LGFLTFCGICVGLILYFIPLLRENWQLAVATAEFIIFVLPFICYMIFCKFPK